MNNTMYMKKIKENNQLSVALCTFNGEKYLSDQLNSIQGQSLTPFELVIGDDASTDTTVTIINNFAAHTGMEVRITRNRKKIGPVNNFSRTLARCTGKYIALSDQDDIWLPEKLETDIKLIRKIEAELGSNTPILLHSDPVLINSSAKTIAPSYLKARQISHLAHKPLKRLILQNFVTGCTVMVNRALLDIALPIPRAAIVHDWWLALVAAAGGRIIFNPDQQVLYRQHPDNLIGATFHNSYANFKRIFFISTLEKEYAATLNQARYLNRRLVAKKMFGPPAYLQSYLEAAANGGYEAVIFMIKNKILKAGCFRNTVTHFILLRRNYLKYLPQRDCNS